MPIVFKGTGSLCVVAAGSGVASTDEVATFAGWVMLEIVYNHVERTEGERVGSGRYYWNTLALLTVTNLWFDPALFNKLWGITANSSDTLSDGTTVSASYTVSQSSVPQPLEVMIRVTDDETQKVIEIISEYAYCNRIPVASGKQGVVTMRSLTFNLLGDSSGNFFKWNSES